MFKWIIQKIFSSNLRYTAKQRCEIYNIPYKKLKDFTNDELFDVIQKNESVDTSILGAICSEILRRMLTENKRDNGGENV